MESTNRKIDNADPKTKGAEYRQKPNKARQAKRNNQTQVQHR